VQPSWNANFIDLSRLQDEGFERTYLKTNFMVTMIFMLKAI
jgi:hypothetical protein